MLEGVCAHAHTCTHTHTRNRQPVRKELRHPPLEELVDVYIYIYIHMCVYVRIVSSKPGELQLKTWRPTAQKLLFVDHVLGNVLETLFIIF